jgi:sirohydrochlorin ferrochelatase
VSQHDIPLLAVAHGSRDPRSAQALAAAIRRLRARHPSREVQLAFLDLNAPSVGQAIDALAARGERRAVVVPLLLGSAFHARVDLPAILAEGRSRHPMLDVRCADILGDDPVLVDAARDSVVAEGLARDDSAVGVALCAVGSRRPAANDHVATVADRVRAATAWQVRACFATSATPTVTEALDELRAAGARTLVVTPWMLAPGLLWDRVLAATAAFPGVRSAAPLAAHADLACVIDARYRDALREPERLRRIA